MIPRELRRRIVDAYESGLSGTYEETARLFAVGRASVSRLLRLHRSTGDIEPEQMGGNRERVIDLEWLKTHAQTFPDARLCDRIAEWEVESGHRVASSTMSNAMRTIGWTHKKNPRRL